MIKNQPKNKFFKIFPGLKKSVCLACPLKFIQSGDLGLSGKIGEIEKP